MPSITLRPEHGLRMRVLPVEGRPARPADRGVPTGESDIRIGAAT